MKDPITLLLTHPVLERYRVLLPYPVFVGLIIFVPVFITMSVLVIVGEIVPQRAPLPAGWRWSPIILGATGAICMAAPLSIAMALGHLSGYRAYGRTWNALTPGDADDLASRLKTAAQTLQFQITWDGGGRRGFVAVHSMHLEMRATNSGKWFPTRLHLFVKAGADGFRRAEMGVGIRTVVIWDTGERDRCRDIGETLVRMVADEAVPVAGNELNLF